MSTLSRLAALALAVLPAAGVPASAGTLGEVVRIEVLDGGATPRGTHLAGLRLTLEPGWKTYWRSPGDAGIPPVFAWGGSANLGAVAMAWPTPQVFEQSGLRSIGYADVVVLPVELTPRTPGGAIRLRGSVDLGVCKEVCVPATLGFDAALDPAAPRHPAIAAALASQPYSEREAGVTAASCALTPTADGVRIETRITMPPAGGREIAVIEAGNPAIWASEPVTERRGSVLVATSDLFHAEGRPIAIDRSAVRVTVLGRNHAVDIRGCTPG